MIDPKLVIRDRPVIVVVGIDCIGPPLLLLLMLLLPFHLGRFKPCRGLFFVLIHMHVVWVVFLQEWPPPPPNDDDDDSQSS
jgi:hypothetical protein